MSNIWLCVNTTDVLFPQIATDARECVIKPLRLVDATGTKLSSKEAVRTNYFCTSCLWRHKQFRPALMVNCHGVSQTNIVYSSPWQRLSWFSTWSNLKAATTCSTAASLDNRTQMLKGAGICAYICPKSGPDVAKYSSTVGHMG
jgi:hypothetical protein